MNPNEIATKADLIAFENRLSEKLSQAFIQFSNKEQGLNLEPLLTRKQVLAYFQITDSVLSEMLTNGLPHVMVNKRPRYDRTEINSFLRNQTKFKL